MICPLILAHNSVSLALGLTDAGGTAQLGWHTPCLPRTRGFKGDKERNASQRKQAFLLQPKYGTVGVNEGSAS